MAKIPLDINYYIEHNVAPNAHRGYLGMSQIGHECERYLYYVLHDLMDTYSYPRTRRIWERGDWEEARIVKDLENIGAKVYDDQLEVTLGDGVIKGHIDGIAEHVPTTNGKPHLLEIKTMAETYWKKLCKVGLKEANYKYYVQANLYASCLDLDDILFVSVNKNTEQRYFEILKVDMNTVIEESEKALRVTSAVIPPPKVFLPSYVTCKFCDYSTFCLDNSTPTKQSCRSCTYFNDPYCDRGYAPPKDLLGCKQWKSCVHDPV